MRPGEPTREKEHEDRSRAVRPGERGSGREDLDRAGFSRADIETRTNRIEGSASALTGIGIPQPDADYYSSAIEKGAALVTLKSEDARAEEAAAIMKGISPWDLTTTKRATGAKAAKGAIREEEGAVIPVVEEKLEVGKRSVETGGVRVFTHVTEVPVEQQVTLREERVDVTRRAVDRPATAKEIADSGDRTLELTERTEKAVVGKSARVVEEVSVGKRVEQHTETVGDTVRRTDVEVEELPGRGRGSAWDLESRELRRHFDGNYASLSGARWESYEPAYRLGYDLSSDRRYAMRDWNAIESDARIAWEAKQPGTWDRMKGAVRHAFDRARARAGAAADRRM